MQAMRFPPKSYNKELESAEDRREREAQVDSIMKYVNLACYKIIISLFTGFETTKPGLEFGFYLPPPSLPLVRTTLSTLWAGPAPPLEAPKSI